MQTVTSASTSGKETLVAQSSSDPTDPSKPHAFLFRFTAEQSIRGKLTLTVSGCGSPQATAGIAATVVGAGPVNTLAWAKGDRLRRLVLNNVLVTQTGFTVLVSTHSSATVRDRRRCAVLTRAAVRFEARMGE